MALPNKYVYDGPQYVIEATGGYRTTQNFDTVHRLPETAINQYDVTGSVEVLYDVRTFNTMIGINKDLSNVGVTSYNFYDMSTNMLHYDSLILTASQFVAGLGNDVSNIISVGYYDSLYSDFAAYVEQYFGFQIETGLGNNIYGTASLYQGLNTFNPNDGIFDASAFLHIITGVPVNEKGGFIDDLSGSITVSNITRLLRFACDANPFGNRDPVTGTTASDPNNPSNYGVTDGFFADDMIFIPDNGIQITLNLAIQAGTFTSTAQSTTAEFAALQDASFNAHTTSDGSIFSESSALSNTGISRTLSAPLLIRLANLTNASNATFFVTLGTTDATTVELIFNGVYSSVTVSRNGETVVANSTDKSYTDSGLNPASTYSYVLQPYIGTSAGVPFAIDATTSIPPPPPPALAISNMNSFMYGTKTPNSIQLLFDGVYSYVSIERNAFTIVSSLNDTSYVNTGLVPNTAYMYKITSYGSTNVAGTQLSFTTYSLAKVNAITTTSIGENSIILNVAGAYTSYNLYRSDHGTTPLTSSAITTASYTDSGLNINTTYTYSVVAYNATGDSTPSTETWAFKTLPKLNLITTGIKTATTIQLIFSGLYEYLSVARSDGKIVAATLYDTSCTDTGLSADLSYSYTATPKNSSGSGTAITDTFFTLPDLAGSIAITAYSSQYIQFSLGGIYYYIKLYRNGSLVQDHIYSGTTSYTDSAVQPNTQYIYQFVPYNHLDQSGTAITITQTTLATLSQFYVGNESTNSTKLLFDGSYSYVNLVRTDGGLQTNVYGDISYTDTNVSPDTPYTYSATPYDVFGNANNAQSLTIKAYTLALLTTGSLVIGQVTGTEVQLGFSGTYDYVDICRNGILLESHVTNKNSYTDLSVQGNTDYTYTIIPYNLDEPYNVPGSQASINVTTLPLIQSPIQYTSSATSIQLIVLGKYDKYDINRNGVSYVTDVTDSSFSDTNLDDDYLYTYIFTPKSHGGLIGATVNISVYTLPTLATLAAGTITSTSIVLNFTGDYQYVDIVREGIVVATNIRDTYQDVSLNSNETYSYSVIPFNPYDVSGTPLNLTGVTTYPSIQSFSTRDLSTNSIGMTFPGYYDYVKLERSDGGISGGGLTINNLYDTSYQDTTNIHPNTMYSYTVTPYHSDGMLYGNPLTLTTYSLPTIHGFAVISASTTSNSIELTYDGSYGYVNIFRTMGQGTTNIPEQIAYKYTNTSFVDVSLNGNSDYSYQIVPYNVSPYDTSGAPAFVNVSTFPNVDSSVNEIVTSSSIYLQFTGNYDYVTITENSTLIVSHLADTSYTDIGLISNVGYIYIITPYHANGIEGDISGIPLTLPIIYTLAEANSSPGSITNSSVLLNITGSYSSVGIFRNSGSSGREMIEVGYISPNGDIIVIDAYTNPEPVMVSWDDPTMDPDADPYGILDPSGNPPESHMDFQVIVLGTRDIASSIRNDAFTDVGLKSNTIYTYSVVPYNAVGIAGESSPVIINTHPKLTTFYADPIIGSTTSVKLVYDGSFDHVDIYRNDELDISNITTYSYIDEGLISAYYPYNYSVIPYNVSGQSDVPLTLTLSTLPLLVAGSFVVTNIASTSITLAFDGQYNYVNIYNTTLGPDASAVSVHNNGKKFINSNLQ